MKLASMQETVAALWAQVPSFPSSSWSTDCQAASFAKYSRLVLAEACPPDVAVPDEPYLRDATWSLIRYANLVKKEYISAAKEAKVWQCRCVFLLWAAVVPSPRRDRQQHLLGRCEAVSQYLVGLDVRPTWRCLSAACMD